MLVLGRYCCAAICVLLDIKLIQNLWSYTFSKQFECHSVFNDTDTTTMAALQFIASFLSHKLVPSLASSVGLYGYLIKLSPSQLPMFLTLHGRPFLQLLTLNSIFMIGFYTSIN